MASAPTMNRGDWATLIGLAMLWGCSFFFIELALRGFQPLTLVFARLALASLLLTGLLYLRGEKLPSGARVWGGLLVLALFNNVVPLSLFSWGQTRIGGGLASILNATMPIWGVLIAHFFTHDEKATANRFVGVAFGFAGAVLMIGWDALAGLGADIVPQLGCLAGALCYAIAGVYARRFGAAGMSPLALSAGSLAMAALAAIPGMLILEHPFHAAMPGAISLAALAAMVILSTGLGYVLYFRLLASAGASNSMLVTFLVPVTAILLGSLVLHERLAIQHVLGMALIGLGLVALDGRLPRRAWGFLRAVPAAP